LWLKDFNSVNPYFLKFILMYFVEKIRKLSQGAAYNALTIEKLEKHQIYVPSISEQELIVKKINLFVTEIKKLENIYQSKILLLEELKQSILQKAFNGELSRNKSGTNRPEA
jgi:type I restriction enzyme S subunit